MRRQASWCAAGRRGVIAVASALLLSALAAAGPQDSPASRPAETSDTRSSPAAAVRSGGAGAPDPTAARAMIHEGRALYDRQDYGGALERFERAADLADAALRPLVLHNVAAARYRLGRVSEARELWARIASSSDVAFEARVRFNLGNCAYAAAWQNLQQALDPKAEQRRALLENAVRELSLAIASYGDALRLDGAIEDARVNLELAARLRRQLVQRLADDCDRDGLPDGEAVAAGAAPDCNANGVPDACDIESGTSRDCNANKIPDECEDCNQNGIPDPQDIESGTSRDENKNCTPDECEQQQDQQSSEDSESNESRNQNEQEQQQDSSSQNQNSSDSQNQNSANRNSSDSQNQNSSSDPLRQSGDSPNQNSPQSDGSNTRPGEQQPHDGAEGSASQSEGEDSDRARNENSNDGGNANERRDDRRESGENSNMNQSEGAPPLDSPFNRNGNASDGDASANQNAAPSPDPSNPADARNANASDRQTPNANSDQANGNSAGPGDRAEGESANGAQGTPATSPVSATGATRAIQLTPEQAARLLQKIRDVERQRRQMKLQREAARYKPAERDW